MNKRETILNIFMVAGYHNDKQTFMRVFVENRVSLQKANEQWRIGVAQKKNGMKCTCYECNRV
jgi:hypothetical protein